MEVIPPIFKDPEQRELYDSYPKPPLTLPVTPGETDKFPRGFDPPLREVLKHRFHQRGSLYRKVARQIATNARRPNRGKHIFIIRPTTMATLLEEKMLPLMALKEFETLIGDVATDKDFLDEEEIKYLIEENPKAVKMVLVK